MKKKFIEKSLQLIKSSKSVDALGEKKLRYGLEAFYNTTTKLIVLIVVAIILDVITELLLITLIYSSLRLYGFGIHAKKSWQCWITTIPIYLGGCIFVKYCEINLLWFFIIWILSFISFALFAPADTPARPLIHKEKRIRAKIFSLIILVIYFGLTLYLNNQLLTNCIIYGLIMEDISINPLTYKLFRTKFNNYKEYQKNMV